MAFSTTQVIYNYNLATQFTLKVGNACISANFNLLSLFSFSPNTNNYAYVAVWDWNLDNLQAPGSCRLTHLLYLKAHGKDNPERKSRW